jgi:hypothetical protein
MGSLEQRLTRLAAALGSRPCADRAHARPTGQLDYREAVGPLLWGAAPSPPRTCPTCGAQLGIPVVAQVQWT